MTKKTKTKKEGNKIKKKPRLKNNSRAGFQKNSSKKNSSNNSKGKYCKTSGCCILSKNISTGVGLIVILATVLVLGCLVLSYEMKNRDCISKIKNERKLLPNQVHREKEGKEGVKNGSEKEELIDMSNWKIYHNKNFNYQVSYPNNYDVREYSSCGLSDNSIDSHKKGSRVVIWNKDFLKTYNPRKYLINSFEININDPSDKCITGHYSPVTYGKKSFKLLKSEKFLINKKEILKRTYIDIPPENTKEDVFEFSTWRILKDNTHYTLAYNDGMLNKPKEKEQLLEKFVNSFVFTKK